MTFTSIQDFFNNDISVLICIYPNVAVVLARAFL
jgi:hypothetical protein